MAGMREGEKAIRKSLLWGLRISRNGILMKMDFATLAKRFKLTGGSIRNIMINAAYLAASEGEQVTMKHLQHGTRRELQKMGKLVSDKDQ